MRHRPSKAKRPGRRSKPISLLSGEIDLVRKAGGPTFAPLRGARFRCNQLPYKGRLTREQVVGIREACGFRGTKREPEKEEEYREPQVLVSERHPYDWLAARWINPAIELPTQGSQGWLAAATGHRTAPTIR